MKRIVPFLVLIVLLSSCGVSRKVATSTVNAADSTRITSSAESVTDKVIDTTKTESGKTTVVEIEFFNPVETTDTTGKVDAPVIRVDETGIHIDNATNVKSVKATTIESESVNKGESRETHAESEKVDSVAVASIETYHHEESAPVAGRKFKTTMLIVAATAIATIIAMLALKRTGFFGWIKKVLSLIASIFK